MRDTPTNLAAGWVAVFGEACHWSQLPASLYIEELFAQAGLLNWRWMADCNELADPAVGVGVIPNGKLLSGADVAPIRAFIERGGQLLVLGRPGPLDALFHVRPQPPVREGWLVPGETLAGRPRAAWRIPLHVFDLVHLLPSDGSDPPAALRFSVGNHAVTWPVSAEVAIGSGSAMLLAADLLASVVRIQQGLTILRDGEPAPDGTAPINDGMLKCDDAILLDWTRDRQRVVPDLPPVFLQPQTDLIRELLMAVLDELADRARMPLLRLDPWPRGLPAVGLVSHNSDLNEPDKAGRQLSADAAANIAATWCIMAGMEDGTVPEYAPELLARIAASGHELAMNYDARTNHPGCQWGPQTLAAQLDRVRRKMRDVGINAAITSNRNHFCRWQGRLEMFRWLIDVGIRVDQTRGGTKVGCLGWPFGSCRPWRPIDDEVSPPYLMNLLEIGFACPDIGGHTTPAAFGRHFIDMAIEHAGVASLVFHPWQADRPAVQASLAEHVAYGRDKGIEWWTARQIADWQFARQAVRLANLRREGNRLIASLRTPSPLEAATLRLTGPATGATRVNLSGEQDAPVEFG